jgi:hypothetical protein
MRNALSVFPLFLILVLVGLAHTGYADNTDTIVHFDSLSQEVILTDFNVSPTSLMQGQTADFAVTMQNLALVSSTVNATVEIYSAANVLVSSFAYDSVAVVPGGVTTVVKTWDSDSLGAGIYIAYVNATYGMGNVTNTLNVSFTITSIPPSGPGGGGGGGAGPDKPKPSAVPPSIVPVGENVRFGRVPAVKEILAGEGELESFVLISSSRQNVSLDLVLSGVPEDWVRLSQNATFVASNGTAAVNLLINVPTDALSGNYLVKIEGEGYGFYTRDYMLLRVKNYPKWHQNPIYLKTIRTDVLAGKTDVSIRLKNPSENTIKFMTVKETLGTDLGDTNSISFKDKRGSIVSIGNEYVSTWNVSDFGPLEEMTISYSLNRYLLDYHDYGTWHLRQIDVGAKNDMASLIKILDMSSQTISPGGTGDVTVSVLYAGEEAITVDASLEVPPGFTSNPGYTSVMLIPRGLTNINFKVTAPQEVRQTHLIRAVILGKDFNVMSTAPVLVKKGDSGFSIPTSPIIIGGTGGQGNVSQATISLPWLDIAIAFVAAVVGLAVLAGLLLFVKSLFSGAGRTVERATYDFERVNDMGTIRKIINKSIKGLGKP